MAIKTGGKAALVLANSANRNLDATNLFVEKQPPVSHKMPQLPAGEIFLEPPPNMPVEEKPTSIKSFIWILPLLLSLVAIAVMLLNRSAAGIQLTTVMGALYAISMMMTMLNQSGNSASRQIDTQRKEYFRYLNQIRQQVRKLAKQQRDLAKIVHVEPQILWAIVDSHRLWERDLLDEHFGSVRVSCGQQQLGVKLRIPQVKSLEQAEPLSSSAMLNLVQASQIVRSVPLAISLLSFNKIIIAGTVPDSRSLARALLVQTATWHSPADIQMMAYLGENELAQWQWLKWLPHFGMATKSDYFGPVRMFADTENKLVEYLQQCRSIEVKTPATKIAGNKQSNRVQLVLVDTWQTVVVEGLETKISATDNALADVLNPQANLQSKVVQIGFVESLPEAMNFAQLDSKTAILEIVDGELVLHRVAQVPDSENSVTQGNAGLTYQLNLKSTSLGKPDELSLNESEFIARRMAKYRVSAPAKAIQSGLTESQINQEINYLELIGVTDLTHAQIAKLRQQNYKVETELKVPLGIDIAGENVVLDLKEASLGGVGPHGICIGATGSGKSELLRTLILGLVLTNSAKQLNLVLVDFKGGATFAGLEQLPHTSALITNLSEDIALVDRIELALSAEIQRRQQILKQAGNFKNRQEYEQARRSGKPLEPMPALLVVVDEFSELLVAKPDFLELFLKIGRIGRSIGVHLLLASQRLEEGRLRGLDTFLSYRIALKTFSAAESRTIIGVNSAYELPSAPGNGYLKTDTQQLIKFKSAYVSANLDQQKIFPNARVAVENISKSSYSDLPLTVDGTTAESAAVRFPNSTARNTNLAKYPLIEFGTSTVNEANLPRSVELVSDTESVEIFGDRFITKSSRISPSSANINPAREAIATASDPKNEINDIAGNPVPVQKSTEADKETLITAATTQLAKLEAKTRKIWLPPIKETPLLGNLLGKLAVTKSSGLLTCEPSKNAELNCVLGVVDDPANQQQYPLKVDLSSRYANLAIIGEAQSGKTTGLKTAIMSLALAKTCEEVSFYCLDFGGGGLRSIKSLPHIGQIASQSETDLVAGTVSQLVQLKNTREKLFAEQNLDSVTKYRQFRKNNPTFSDRFAQDVFLVIDGWSSFKQNFEGEAEQVVQLAANGMGFGIHLFVSSANWTQLGSVLKANLQNKVELKLADPYDSAIDRHAQAKLLINPGWALTPDGLQLAIAKPEIASEEIEKLCNENGVEILPNWADEPAAALPALIKKCCPLEPAVGIAVLPEKIKLDLLTSRFSQQVTENIKKAVGTPAKTPQILIGLSETMQISTWDLSKYPHLVVCGRSGCGKTSLIQLITRQILENYSPQQAKILLFDYRRTLLEKIPSDYLIGYVGSAAGSVAIAEQTAAVLRSRLPGPEVTPQQLVERSWWSGKEVFVIVDDYELVSDEMNNPLSCFADLVNPASDIGLHIVLTRNSAGIGRALFSDPIISRIKNGSSLALVMDTAGHEAELFYNVKPSAKPVGRALLASRNGAELIQIADVTN